jgi:hypothetical protein
VKLFNTANPFYRMSKIEFFKKTTIWWVLPISFGMSLLGWCVYEPSTVPHRSLGVLGKLTKELVDNYPSLLQVTWYAALAAHIGEAIYAYKLASQLVNLTIYDDGNERDIFRILKKSFVALGLFRLYFLDMLR